MSIPGPRKPGGIGGSLFNAVNRATKASADVIAAAGGGGGKKGCLIWLPVTAIGITASLMGFWQVL